MPRKVVRTERGVFEKVRAPTSGGFGSRSMGLSIARR